jgi:hypothetical protein
MRAWRYAALPLALLASRAPAANWVTVGTDNDNNSTYVDKDSIRRGTDGLVYFDEATDDGDVSDLAADCKERVLYLLRMNATDNPDWRSRGHPVTSGSVGEGELQYVCANVG